MREPSAPALRSAVKSALVQERSVCPAPLISETDITIGAGGAVQAGTVGGGTIGEDLPARIELSQLMILIPERLRSQRKIRAVAVADGHVETIARSGAAVDIIQFFVQSNFFSSDIVYSSLIELFDIMRSDTFLSVT